NVSDGDAEAAETAVQAPKAAPTYRLCQIDKEGQVRAQSCPPAQVPVISMAIVRHQKLVKLGARKTAIEDNLKRVVETLGDLKTLLT
ncbi:MAG: hypothetical protein AAFU71_12435, partial [Cyanobacteria bacterium J06632_22]